MARKDRQGFALLVVVLVLALVSVVGLMVVDVVNVEQRMIGFRRIAVEARATAEGGALEVINDGSLSSYLPGFASESYSTVYEPSSSSPFVAESDEFGPARSFSGRIDLVRHARPDESGIGTARVFVYEVTTVATVDGGRAEDEVRAEIIKIFSPQEGVVLPEVHAR